MMLYEKRLIFFQIKNKIKKYKKQFNIYLLKY